MELVIHRDKLDSSTEEQEKKKKRDKQEEEEEAWRATGSRK